MPVISMVCTSLLDPRDSGFSIWRLGTFSGRICPVPLSAAHDFVKLHSKCLGQDLLSTFKHRLEITFSRTSTKNCMNQSK